MITLFGGTKQVHASGCDRKLSLNLVQTFFSFFSAPSYFLFVIFIGLSGVVIGSSPTYRR